MKLIKENYKRYLISGLITFTSTFLISFGSGLTGEIDKDVIIALSIASFRAGAKAVVEIFYKYDKVSK